MMTTQQDIEALVGNDPTRLIQDSRALRPGVVFFAIRGTAHDGHVHVQTALDAGAAACVVDEQYEIPAAISEANRSRILRVSDTRESFGKACAAACGNPSRSMILVGVTGTSGKTTTTYLIESVLRAAGHRVGVIGTVNFRIGDRILPSTHTTPGAAELQALLADMRLAGCTAVVMEVSSHALKQHRTAGIAFDCVSFGNLTPEHLDFHPDMEDYFQSKRLLLTRYLEESREVGKTPVAVVNLDDDHGRRLVADFRNSPEAFWGVSLAGASGAGVDGTALRLDMSGVSGSVSVRNPRDGKTDRLELKTPLVARFNACNSLMALAVGLALKLPTEDVLRGIASLAGVPGRLERVSNDVGINVLVDYAHKPDALEKVLKTLVELRSSGQRILTVVGCGGDRDRTKRPVMGRLAEQFSDLAIITSDNPRTENPASIIDEILTGISRRDAVIVEPDRRKAIFEAIHRAHPGDLVLIAGKGHEDYQILADPSAPGGTRKIHFDDREVAAEACRNRPKA